MLAKDSSLYILSIIFYVPIFRTPKLEPLLEEILDRKILREVQSIAPQIYLNKAQILGSKKKRYETFWEIIEMINI